MSVKNKAVDRCRRTPCFRYETLSVTGLAWRFVWVAGYYSILLLDHTNTHCTRTTL